MSEEPNNHEKFREMVDYIIKLGDEDPELKDGLQWLDKQAQKEGVSIYDKVFETLYKHDTKQRAKDWLDRRN